MKTHEEIKNRIKKYEVELEILTGETLVNDNIDAKYKQRILNEKILLLYWVLNADIFNDNAF